MWQASFIATSVALGVGVEDALAAIDAPGASASALVSGLRAAERPKRAATLAAAIHKIVLAIDDTSLSKAPAAMNAAVKAPAR
jgi:hypothetical protein